MGRACGWWDDPDELDRRYVQHGSWAKLSRATGVPESTLKTARQRHAAAQPAPPLDDELTVEVTDARDIDGLLRSRGLDPADWIVASVVVNEWGDTEHPQQQLKVYLKRRLSVSLLQPAEIAPLAIPVSTAKLKHRSGRLVFVYGDDQRPNVDRGFEDCKLQWITEHQPDVIVDLGDGMDFPTVSQNKPNPAFNWSVQECADDYASWLYSVRLAAPNADIVVLADNHVTQRWRDYQLSQAAALYGVKPADVEGLDDDLEPLLSIRRLLRLDEMNVRYLQPDGDTHYAESQYEIVPGELVALHGYRTGANVGRKLLSDYGCSVVYGHVHEQGVHVTDWRRRGVGERQRLYAIGVGCGAVVHGGNGFAPGADWANGALTVTVHDDGRWNFDLMTYERGVALWRGERFECRTAGTPSAQAA